MRRPQQVSTDAARVRSGASGHGARALWRRLDLRVVVLLLAVLLVAPVWACPAEAEAAAGAQVPMTGTPTTYPGHSYEGVRGGNASEDDPQSKLWWNDGSWWALMVSPAGRVHVYELMPDHTWRDTGTAVDDRPESNGDALWDGTGLYVASRAEASSLRVLRLSYDPGARQYSVDSGFPVELAGGGTGSATIAKDSTGRLWLAWTQALRVWVAHSLADGTSWSAPFVPPVPGTSVIGRDTAAVISFGGRIGVLWSVQASGSFRFAVHADGTPPGTWTSETPLAGPAMSDDHVNIKTLSSDPAGRLHVAVKTAFDETGAEPGAPLVLVLTRGPDGTWTQSVAATVEDGWTAPVLVLDEANAELHVLGSSGRRVYHKTTQLSDISFPSGRGQVFMEMAGGFLNDPSTSKQPVTADSGLVVLASSTTDMRYYHSELAVRRAADVVAPSPPGSLRVTAGDSSQTRLSWSAATDDRGVVGYRVHRDGVRIAQVPGTTYTYTDGDLRGSTTYLYFVEAYDSAGNVSPPSGTVTARTGEASPRVCRLAVGDLDGSSGAVDPDAPAAPSRTASPPAAALGRRTPRGARRCRPRDGSVAGRERPLPHGR